MKKTLEIALLACAGALASMSTLAGGSADEFVGTWRSPQALDTYLKISQTPAGLVVSEVHQNLFGGASIESKPASVEKGMLQVGTVVYQYEKQTNALIVYLGENRYLGFVRDPS